MNIEKRTDYDALIVGGGPAGSTAAILLAQAGWRVAVAEKRSFPRRKVCGEFVSATSWPLLRELGVAKSILEQAGPEIRRVGLYADETILTADMPSPRNESDGWGRALGRGYLDPALLARAREVGADAMQPLTISRIAKIPGGYMCSGSVKERPGKTEETATFHLRSRIVIAAHGSWESGAMPTQRPRHAPRASDLFAFKAHFRDGTLPFGLMPLVLFPDGYGGMVQTGQGGVSLSCCIRRDALERCRRKSGTTRENARAGDAVLAHVQASCRGVREALSGATLDGTWLSAGPIRPGIRLFRQEGLFSVGNVAGEAHPIVAEGISMAIQSAWLLCELLLAHQDAVLAADPRDAHTAIGHAYEHSWRRNFGTRVHAAALFAHLGMRPATAEFIVALLKRAPRILTIGAYWSGKTQTLRSLRSADAI